MDLPVKDRRALAELFADALPSWSDRAEVARRAGLADVQLSGEPVLVWTLLIGQAVEQGKLPNLVRAAHHRQEAHAALASVAETLATSGRIVVPRSLPWAPLGLGLAVLVLGAAAVLFWPSAAPEAGGVAQEPSTDAGAATVAAPAKTPPPAVAEVEPTPAAAPADPAEPAAPTEPAADAPAAEDAPDPGTPAPSEAPEAERSAAAEPTPPRVPQPSSTEGTALPTAPASDPEAHCAGKTGWTFVGSTSDLKAGDLWVVDQHRNVRSEPPSAENGYSPRMPLVCVVSPGWAVRLVADPVEVPGGAFWLQVGEGAAPVVRAP